MMRGLSDADSWSIIKKRAFSGGKVPREVKAVGKEIARKCKGLPLAANMIGATLQGKRSIDDWNSVLRIGFSDSNTRENSVLQVLKVSFDRLPSLLLKKCFAYCSIFKKDEILDRERLVQLWMAEGFLVQSRENDMEGVYDNLLDASFFLKEAYENIYLHDKNNEYCKMHDLVHDLALSVSKEESFNGENRQVDNIPRVRYLAVESLGDEVHNKVSKDNAIYLRTLIVDRSLPDCIYKDLKYLRVLNMSGTRTRELSASIGKLIHLRYLDVSDTGIRALPESICNLFNLQTLRIVWCPNLKELPKQFNRLVNLRHLLMDEDLAVDCKFPLGIENLTGLRTFKFFPLGHEKGHRIDELKCLKNLKGLLKISNLELVDDKDEALKANLIEKPDIRKLVLKWCDERDNDNHEEVLEGLQPHQNLKELIISRFCGDNFPSWTMNMNLNNLTQIKIKDCKCQEIPTLGHLPLLKKLVFWELINIKSMGPRFYYPKQHESIKSSNTWFPALQSLTMWKLPNLVEWVEIEETTPFLVNAFPVLENLEITNCPKLVKAPSHGFPSVKRLSIVGVDSRFDSADKTWWSKFTSLTSLSITSVSSLTCHPDRLLQQNKSLEILRLSGCDKLTKLTFDEHKLKSIYIYDCRDLISISCEMPESFMSLESLKVSRCPNLTSFPLNSISMPRLSKLEFSDCPHLISISSEMPESFMSLQSLIVSKCPNLTSFPLIYSISMPRLSELKFFDCPHLISISCEMPESFMFLQSLKVSQCPNLTSFPLINSISMPRLSELEFSDCPHLISISSEMPESFISLKSLKVSKCPNLTSFPLNSISMPRLSHLEISHCPNLMSFPQSLSGLEYLSIDQRLSKSLNFTLLNETLRELTLFGSEDCDSLLDQLQYLTNLTELTIRGFGRIESLPEWLGNLSSLTTLILRECNTLRYLPSKQAMQQINYLRIWDCPMLKERCKEQQADTDDSEWQKIAHIPKRYIH